MASKKAERPGMAAPSAQESQSTGIRTAAKTKPKQPDGQAALPLSAITVAPECQLRAAESAAAVSDYAAALADGATFPAIIVFHDGAKHWLADGFHRLEAHKAAGIAKIAVDVREGTRRDALLFAASANATHGLRRTSADKQRAIAAVLADPEWRRWSDKEIARRTATSDKSVAKARRELSGEGVNAEFREETGELNAEIRVEERAYITRQGTEATRRVVANGTPIGIPEHIARGLSDDLIAAEVLRRPELLLRIPEILHAVPDDMIGAELCRRPELVRDLPRLLIEQAIRENEGE